MKPDYLQAAQAVEILLHYIDRDPGREGLRDTPKRVVQALSEMTSGDANIGEILSTTFSADGYDEMIVVKGIEFVSLCEHHVLPFLGVAHVGYVPHDSVIGLSKIPRLVVALAKQLQIQERLTKSIADELSYFLKPKGVGVVLKASHECLGCRGARQPNVEMITSAMRGVFMTKPEARAEFMKLIEG